MDLYFIVKGKAFACLVYAPAIIAGNHKFVSNCQNQRPCSSHQRIVALSQMIDVPFAGPTHFALSTLKSRKFSLCLYTSKAKNWILSNFQKALVGFLLDFPVGKLFALVASKLDSRSFCARIAIEFHAFIV